MPLKITKKGSKYRVCDSKGKCLSKKGLSKKQAQKQELAVRLSTLRSEGRIPPRMTGKGSLGSSPVQPFLWSGLPLSFKNGNPSFQKSYVSSSVGF